MRRRSTPCASTSIASTLPAASTASKIKLVIEDDGAQPSKAAANTKKLITQDNVVLMVNASLSSTYAPVIAETKSAGVPLLFASGVCPKSVYPPAEALQFCTTGYAANYDSQATLDFVKAPRKAR